MVQQLTIVSDGATALVINGTRERAKRVFDYLDVSEATRQEYKYRIDLFLRFSQGRPITRNSFLEFKRYLVGRRDWAVSTKNKYLAAARIYLKEANRQGVLSSDITQNIKSFGAGKRHKRDGLNDEEMSKLTEAIKVLPDTLANARLKAILSLLVFQGLRQIEITRLDVKDIDFVSKIVFIQGKGRDDKEPINLHPEVVKTLQDYLKSCKIADGALFVSQSNNSKDRRLTTRALRGIVKETLDVLGIKKTTHGFRHYFVTKLLKIYKGDLLEVAQYTRHKSLEMLQVYNDNIKRQADLPRYYGAFAGVSF